MINILDKNTIDQIAAGEVIERPASVVKELVENAVDAGSSAVTIEIKNGGIDLIRVTDNGSGIEENDIKIAFFRHATSKIKKAADLLSIHSLGFRGEALSSIASIARVELLSKTAQAFIGRRYVIEGGEEKTLEEAGCPDGTTFLVKDLFYNTPVRRKFLKSPGTEAGYVCEMVEKQALCHPEISFKLIVNGKVQLHTAGHGKLKETFMELYGLDMAKASLEVNITDELRNYHLSGIIAKPYVSRGNRNLEGFFVNGRFVKCAVLRNALEDGYKGYMMGHCYPVCALFLDMPSDQLDVNVHPSKLELRFTDTEAVYRLIFDGVREALSGKTMIVNQGGNDKSPSMQHKEKVQELNNRHLPEAFEVRKPAVKELITPENTPVAIPESLKIYSAPEVKTPEVKTPKPKTPEPVIPGGKEPEARIEEPTVVAENNENILFGAYKNAPVVENPQQESFIPDLYKEREKEFRIVGQVLGTFWIIEMDNTVFMIDQHAAHEKVLYERTMKRLREKETFATQAIFPGKVVGLSVREVQCIMEHLSVFTQMGFEIEEFGLSDVKITGLPADFVDIDLDAMFKEVVASLMSDRDHKNPEILNDRIATISCKAAVKGNTILPEEEARKLISDMLTLEDPYHCPHGRPTTISYTREQMDKMFKRII